MLQYITFAFGTSMFDTNIVLNDITK